MEDGSTAVLAGTAERLVRVYSRRISEESDLGIVWRAEVIPAILEAQQRDQD